MPSSISSQKTGQIASLVMTNKAKRVPTRAVKERYRLQRSNKTCPKEYVWKYPKQLLNHEQLSSGAQGGGGKVSKNLKKDNATEKRMQEIH